MSSIPDSVRAANDVIRAGAASEGYRAIISVRATRSARGYHAGRAEIYGPDGQGDDDYSIQRRRDKAGLSDASAAQDISFRRIEGVEGSGAKARDAQVRLVRWLVDRAKAGLAPDLVEVIGPGADGRAYYHARPYFRPIRRAKGDSHEWHIHAAHFRDAEFHDLASMFRPFWPALADPIPTTPDDPDPAPIEDPLQDELDAARVRIAELRDGLQLAATEVEQRAVELDVIAGVMRDKAGPE